MSMASIFFNKEKQAVKQYMKAAEQGDANAQYNLGRCYADGEGVEKDQKKAVYWYTKAAEQELARAQNNLAICYENGEGVERDMKKAVYWYTKAAEQGHARAQKILGNIRLWYDMGEGVEKDQYKAVNNVTYLSTETLIQGNVGIYAKDDAIVNRPIVGKMEPDDPKNIYCPDCGKKLPVDAIFCLGCGKKLEGGE